MARHRDFTPVLRIVGMPVLVWALHFLAIYGATAIACARGWQQTAWLSIGAVPWWVAACTLVAVGVLAVHARRTVAREARTPAYAKALSRALSALALLAILWQALPATLVPACA